MAQYNANIKNINTIGLIMRIALIIARILVGIAFVLTFLGCILSLWMPIEDVKLKPSVHLEVDYDGGLLGDADLKEESHSGKWDIDEIGVKWYLKTQDITEDKGTILIDGKADEITGSQIKGFIFKKCLIAMLFSGALFIALIFGGKLAKALEKCETPFSEEVIAKLVGFGKSLIPLGVLSLLTGTTGIAIAFAVLILILFVNLFKYGAELQKDVDETV